MSLQDNVKNGLLTGGLSTNFGANAPAEYGSRNTRFFETSTTKFAQSIAKYSSDYFDAEIQGVFEKAPYKWTHAKIRMADVVRPSAAITRYFDDFKTILVAEPPIDYLKPGTKILTMGNCWIVTNPANISNPVGNGIVRRCNAVWNHLDYYGNVVSEPIIVENMRANASDSDHQESGLITKGYFNVIAQYNKNTAQLDTNSRLILGSGAYRVTGYSDFQQEFTGEYQSVRLLEFAVRYEEPNNVIDDLENHVAGGKNFSWNIELTGAPILSPENSMTIVPTSVRNGAVVESTDNHPINYSFTSDNEEVATVDETGKVIAVGTGEAIITVSLDENDSIKSDFRLLVSNSTSYPHVAFLNVIPEKISAYQSVSLSAAFFLNGERTSDVVSWEFKGADKNAYKAEIQGNTVEISCWNGSVEPLEIIASCNGETDSMFISLEGV